MYTGIPGASAIAGPHPAAQQLLRLRGGVALAQRGLEARRALLRLQAALACGRQVGRQLRVALRHAHQALRLCAPLAGLPASALARLI